MPEFMDVHRSVKGITPEQLNEAHRADLAIQDEEGADFKHAWADPASGMVFCLPEAPSAEAVKRIHERAGHPADDILRSTGPSVASALTDFVASPEAAPR